MVCDRILGVDYVKDRASKIAWLPKMQKMILAKKHMNS